MGAIRYSADLRAMEELVFVVDGGWSPWSDWTECSKSCAGGTANRNRTCTSPEPSHGGQVCIGGIVEMHVCNEHPCPRKY